MSVAQLLQAIRDLDYEPEIVEVPPEPVVVADRIATASLPDDLVELFGQARALGKPVLVEFSGPG